MTNRQPFPDDRDTNPGRGILAGRGRRDRCRGTRSLLGASNCACGQAAHDLAAIL